MQSIDDECVVRVLGGDMASFEHLMRRHNQRLFRAARAVVGDDAEAEDVVQDAYTRAYLALDRYRPGSFGGWVLTIVLNEARTRRRRLARREALLREREPLQATEPNVEGFDGPEGAVASQQLRQVLERAIDALPEEHRIVFVLRELEQLSTRETAEQVECSEAAVRTRLHRGKAALRELLSEQIGRGLADAFSFAGARCDRIVSNVLAKLKRHAVIAH